MRIEQTQASHHAVDRIRLVGTCTCEDALRWTLLVDGSNYCRVVVRRRECVRSLVALRQVLVQVDMHAMVRLWNDGFENV